MNHAPMVGMQTSENWKASVGPNAAMPAIGNAIKALFIRGLTIPTMATKTTAMTMVAHIEMLPGMSWIVDRAELDMPGQGCKLDTRSSSSRANAVPE